MKTIILVLGLLAGAVVEVAQAADSSHDFELGMGISSVTSGRLIPALKASAYLDKWELTVSSVGVRTSVYAQNAWTFGVLRELEGDSNSWLAWRAHVGVAGAYFVSALRDDPSAPTRTTTDFVAGPAWSLTFAIGPALLSFDAIHGLRDPVQHLFLNFQDVYLVSVGAGL